MLEEGQKVPAFTMPTDTVGDITAASLAGQKYVIYFYPKDDTPGCTKEAIGFSEQAADFDALGVKVIGVSRDTIEKHAKFRAKHDLSVILAADVNEDVCENFGVWVEKNMYGRKYMGIERATFLVDETGTIRNIWRKVKVKDHVAAVLDAARAL
ncbi:thioredoxin-dependent thiol peroxidase [Sneathiella chinensis]|uniref:thioredoxin-dependent peroxiredoxin n=1 Tax=Sneathiella chinensis TaxID=349750 RepID=A0ABQ5UAG4_9PROT|nr:thioredoxin-dependent thiol peroxidase [Sneathiella chinensis]GLQ07556.1 peroxiredoxin [Sneathiella chinensis]